VCVHFGSSGSGWIGLRPAAGVDGAELPRCRHAGNSSEFTEFGAPRVKSSGAWVCRAQHDTRDPPGALSGPGGAQGCVRGGGGGSTQRHSPACGVSAVGIAYGLQHLAQKGQERALVLTEGSDWPEKHAGGSMSMVGGGDEAALMERTAAGVHRAPRLHGSTRGVPAEVILGSRSSGNHRR
jgi:hypothetical protein